MSINEFDIIQKLGCSSFSIYTYVKEFPRSSNLDLETSLAISMPTIRRSLQKLESSNIIKRVLSKNNSRTIIINPEQTWKL